MKRKDLEPITRPVETHFGVYDKSEADSVMDAMENRIKELEKKLSDTIASRDSFKELYYHEKNAYELMVKGDITKKDERIKELEAENSQLKKDLEHARSYKHTIKMRNRNLQT